MNFQIYIRDEAVSNIIKIKLSNTEISKSVKIDKDFRSESI